MFDIIDINTSAIWSIGVITLILFVGTLLLLPILVARIPADYFVRDRTGRQEGRKPDSVRSLVMRVLRNVLGVVFVGAGIVMLVTPGQGLLSILIGITLTDFPGKVRLGRRIVRQPGVFKTVNWIRRKAHVPPLQMPKENGRSAEGRKV